PQTDHKLINELSRLGGLQKHLFKEGNGVGSKEYAEILQAIKAAIFRIEQKND
ncbi:mobilization protein, partial [Klebsiella pneumoniae]|nr:mobilization protein [Klebsiella pneumoniae]